MTFNLPVTVTFAYEDADLGSYDESTLSILRYSGATATPVELSDVFVDFQGNTVSGQTTQFSYMRLRAMSGGGELEGTWSYDHTDFDIVNPDPFYDVMLDGYGNMTVNFTSTNFTSQGTRYLHEVVTVFGMVYLDTVFTYVVDLGGTHTTSNGTITTVVTYDRIMPSNVGSEVTMNYSADATDLMLRYSDIIAGYDVTVTEFYIRR